ncbi:hypothetical protein SPHINGO391_390353 [Sphingomonas aurantiaca]|uniref:Uncharacterized protein n=1 Tax=Sphingomonas aurantiaca TaxID=185949 RepID=A0A5E7YU51_9SPHN|nr:hypothetical protein SPHINGO391_390353 [Sphingomonas aurantiaca]
MGRVEGSGEVLSLTPPHPALPGHLLPRGEKGKAVLFHPVTIGSCLPGNGSTSPARTPATDDFPSLCRGETVQASRSASHRGARRLRSAPPRQSQFEIYDASALQTYFAETVGRGPDGIVRPVDRHRGHRACRGRDRRCQSQGL